MATLYSMKKIEIIIQGGQLDYIKDLLQRAKVTGYTVIPNLAGMGHSGYHEGQLMFNQVNTLVMIITVVPIDLLDGILDGLGPLFEKHSGVVFVSDTAVSRLNYFVADQATAA